MNELKIATAKANMPGLLTKGRRYVVKHQNKDYVTVIDDRGQSCVYSEIRFDITIHTPKGSPDFSEIAYIEDEVNLTLQPDESGIICPVVEQEKLRKALARITELEQEVEVLRRYGNKDCTAMADEELTVLKRGAQ